MRIIPKDMNKSFYKFYYYAYLIFISYLVYNLYYYGENNTFAIFLFYRNLIYVVLGVAAFVLGTLMLFIKKEELSHFIPFLIAYSVVNTLGYSIALLAFSVLKPLEDLFF
ncbi:hypothetical protein ACFL0C_02335 [Patescibacteria group bacterium]